MESISANEFHELAEAILATECDETVRELLGGLEAEDISLDEDLAALSYTTKERSKDLILNACRRRC